MRRSQIFLADLLRAIVRLDVRDPQLARTVLRMLSLDHLEAVPEARRQSVAAPTVPTHATERPPLLRIEVPPPPPASPPLGAAREAVLRPIAVAPTSPSPPAWLAATAPMPRPAGPTPASLSFAPLFPRGQSRGLLTVALATIDQNGPLDLERAVEHLAELRPLRELPRERSTTLRLGVQLLIEGGLPMAPFAADIADLRIEIARLLSPDRIAEFRFVGTPLRRCVANGRGKARPWISPGPRTPIIIVSDLGIGAPDLSSDRAGTTDWLEFLDAADTAGNPVTALVPYGPPRWPRALAGTMRIVHWDRRTSAAAILRALSERTVSSA